MLDVVDYQIWKYEFLCYKNIGAGYIGSHCCVELLEAGYNVIAIDNFANWYEGLCKTSKCEKDFSKKTEL